MVICSDGTGNTFSKHAPSGPAGNYFKIPNRIPDPEHRIPSRIFASLKPMTEAERIVADFAGMGLLVGRHPMALRRDELAMGGVLRAIDLHAVHQDRRVRVGGMIITRQRPGTAKGFVFLTLEDETGIANIIVRPDLFTRDRLVIIEEPFLIVEGVLQNQEGVTSVRAEAVFGMRRLDVDFDAHDFYSPVRATVAGVGRAI
jgi:error-prone DNA polymerase